MSELELSAHRHHDVSVGHRVYGHEGACANLHGHNYRFHFECRGEPDALGRVIDFRVVKERLCNWLEREWDHRMLLWVRDPWLEPLRAIDPSVVWVPFNPTAENLAAHLLAHIGPIMLEGTGVELVEVLVEETRRCAGSARWKP